MAAAILLTGCASQTIEPPVPNSNAPIWFPSASEPVQFRDVVVQSAPSYPADKVPLPVRTNRPAPALPDLSAMSRTSILLASGITPSWTTNINGTNVIICGTNRLGKFVCFTNPPVAAPLTNLIVGFTSPSPAPFTLPDYPGFEFVCIGTWIQSRIWGAALWTNHYFVPACGSNVAVTFPFAPAPGKEFRMGAVFAEITP